MTYWAKTSEEIIKEFSSSENGLDDKEIDRSMGMKEMNVQLCSISRVVVHTKYRTISLGTKLVRETLKLCGTPHVEMSAVMG